MLINVLVFFINRHIFGQPTNQHKDIWVINIKKFLKALAYDFATTFKVRYSKYLNNGFLKSQTNNIYTHSRQAYGLNLRMSVFIFHW